MRMGGLISPWWTEGPVGYNGVLKLKSARKRGKIAPKTCFTHGNRRQTSRESSIDSHIGEQNRDIDRKIERFSVPCLQLI